MSHSWTIQRLLTGIPESSRIGVELGLYRVSLFELQSNPNTDLAQSREKVGMGIRDRPSGSMRVACCSKIECMSHSELSDILAAIGILDFNRQPLLAANPVPTID
jgi:hypothetical protein